MSGCLLSLRLIRYGRCVDQNSGATAVSSPAPLVFQKKRKSSAPLSTS